MIDSQIEGIIYRLKWAEEHVNNLIHDIEAVNEANKSAFAPEIDKERSKITLYARNIKFVRPDMGVIIGMYAHNLRSILDNIVWSLALKNTPNPNPYTAFPICIRRHGRTAFRFGRKRVAFYSGDRGSGKTALQSLHHRHIQMIEKLQPYKSGNGGSESPIFILSELNNADKHRAVQVCTSFLEITSISTPRIPEFSIRSVKNFSIGRPATEGMKLAEISYKKSSTKIKQPVHCNFATNVFFIGGASILEGRPVALTLRDMMIEVIKIVNVFSSEIGHLPPVDYSAK